MKTNKEISKNLGEVVKKIKYMESKKKDDNQKVTIERKKTAKRDDTKRQADETIVEISSNKDILIETEQIDKHDDKKHDFKCLQCEYVCQEKNTLN